jgi:hypothetical protein
VGVSVRIYRAKRVEGSRDKVIAVKTNCSARRAAKAKEKPAGLSPAYRLPLL